MKLLGITKNKINNNENDVLYLEIIEVVLVRCNIVNNGCKNDSRV